MIRLAQSATRLLGSTGRIAEVQCHGRGVLALLPSAVGGDGAVAAGSAAALAWTSRGLEAVHVDGKTQGITLWNGEDAVLSGNDFAALCEAAAGDAAVMDFARILPDLWAAHAASYRAARIDSAYLVHLAGIHAGMEQRAAVAAVLGAERVHVKRGEPLHGYRWRAPQAVHELQMAAFAHEARLVLEGSRASSWLEIDHGPVLRSLDAHARTTQAHRQRRMRVDWRRRARRDVAFTTTTVGGGGEDAARDGDAAQSDDAQGVYAEAGDRKADRVAVRALQTLGLSTAAADASGLLSALDLHRPAVDQRVMALYPPFEPEHWQATDALVAMLGEHRFPVARSQSPLEKALERDGSGAAFARSSGRSVVSHTIYSLDPAGARAIDDGFSVSDNWTYVHIADPTAWIGTDDVLFAAAMERTKATYLDSKRVLPMLPAPLLPLLGLHDARRSYGLTVAFRLDERTGDVLDSHVEPTVLPPVRRITYHEADKVLDPDRKDGAQKGHILSELKRRLSPRLGFQDMMRRAKKADGIRKVQSALSAAVLRELVHIAGSIVGAYGAKHAIALPPPINVVSVRENYVRTTSPLRRFTDLLVLTQITGHLLDGSAPFDAPDVADILARVEAKDAALQLAQADAGGIRELVRHVRLLGTLGMDKVTLVGAIVGLAGQPSAVVLDNFGFRLPLSPAQSASLAVGDVVRVAVNINERADVPSPDSLDMEVVAKL